MRNLIYIVAIILIVFWIFGAFVSPFAGNYIHLLLLVAIFVVLFRIIKG